MQNMQNENVKSNSNSLAFIISMYLLSSNPIYFDRIQNPLAGKSIQMLKVSKIVIDYMKKNEILLADNINNNLIRAHFASPHYYY